jgi:hypothetical protein
MQWEVARLVLWSFYSQPPAHSITINYTLWLISRAKSDKKYIKNKVDVKFGYNLSNALLICTYSNFNLCSNNNLILHALPVDSIYVSWKQVLWPADGIQSKEGWLFLDV